MNTMTNWVKMSDWLNDFQSVNRGFRPGMEVNIATSRKNGKSVWMDMESDTHLYWEHVWQPHYVEMYNESGQLQWYRYPKKPNMGVIYEATTVVRQNSDGSFEYTKNRAGTGLRVLNEEEEKEFLFIMLSAEVMHR